MIEERAEQVGVKDDGCHGRGGLMGGAVVGEKSKNRGLLAMVGGVLLLAVVAGGGFWLWDGEGTERKAQNDFCWSLVPGGKPEDGASTAECGDALETAMTGQLPGAPAPEEDPEHGDARLHVFEETVRGYADRAMPEEIRRNMANVLTHYTADVHGVLAERKGEARTDMTVRDLTPFLRGVVEDEEAFRAVHGAQTARVAEALGELGREDFTRIPEGGTDRAMGTVSDGGTVLGTLTRIRSAVIAETTGDDDPTVKQELIDTHEEYGLPRLRRMIRERAVETGVSEDDAGKSGGRTALLLQEAGQAYTTAANRA